MAVRTIAQPRKYIGLSTDTKPTEASNSAVREGSTFYEYDTNLLYITHDGTSWVLKEDITNADAWRFGQPELRHDNEGWGQWENKALQAKFKDSYDTNRQFRYGNWAVHLNGGPQASEESWASVSIPVNEMTVASLVRMEYTWYNHVTGTGHIGYIAPNFVWSAYDKDDHSKRVDFNTYAVDNGGYNPTAGWHEFLITNTDATERVYWYGNNTGTHDTAPDEGEDGYWSEIVSDTVFKNWVIYRVQIMEGYWGSTRSTGDVWIGGLKINGIPVKWEPSEAGKTELFEKERNMFGKPTLMSNNNSKATWFKSGTSPYYQKSATGWLAELYGGVQTGDDWAGVMIPVNEMRVPDLKTAKWSYYMSATDTFGVNMVIWVHDPFNPDNRAEITLRQQHSSLAKAAGWNSHIMNPETAYFFFWGDGTLTNSNLSGGTDYAWNHHTSTTSSFVTDELFNTWTIYRISIEFGWQAAGTFGTAYVADIEINGQLIPLYPDTKTYSKSVKVSKVLEADGTYTAKDVMSEAVSQGTGTPWVFEMGGTGKITQAVANCTLTTRTSALGLYLYTTLPSCELDDNAPFNGPLLADNNHFVGYILFPALATKGGPAFSIVTGSLTTGNLPLSFGSPTLYGVLVDITGEDYDDDEPFDLILTAELEA